MSLAADITDIDATIAHWRGRGLTAAVIAAQLGCGRSWFKVRRRMIVMITPRRETVPEPTIIALIGIRRRRGLTQRQVASRIGMSQVSISYYEKGETAPSDKVLAAWRAALGLRAKPSSFQRAA